jgi:superfamily II DNA or RNA helicase
MSSKPFWQQQPGGTATTPSTSSEASSTSRIHGKLNAVLATPQTPVNILKSGFRLRDYQSDAIEAILHALTKEMLNCIGVSAPAGSGKTTILTNLIPLLPQREEADKVLIIVPFVHLIGQTEETLRHYLQKKYHIGIEQGDTVSHASNDMWVSLTYWYR